MSDAARLSWQVGQTEKTVDLPVHRGTYGQTLIDVTQLGKQGALTYDPGFLSTAACASAITYIDGQAGRLLYRGYPIESLVDHCDYLQVCYLLLYGELPQPAAYTAFCARIGALQSLPPTLTDLLPALSPDGHPMALLMTLLSALASLHHARWDKHSAKSREEAALLLIAMMPVLVALCYRHTRSDPQQRQPIAPRNDLSYTENFLYMLWGQVPDAVQVSAMDKIFILHADHEQNASTSTVRLAGSTGTDPLAAWVCGVAALWGPAHGGANESCLAMLESIQSVVHIPDYIARAKDSQDPFRLVGFGHRVYKNYDPRAKVMRQFCHAVLESVSSGQHAGSNAGNGAAVLEVALALEKIAREDAYFIARHLYPNVDFYSGITQRAMGIPPRLFTAIFALSRTSGWAAHWLEMWQTPPLRIGRPRQWYRGPQERAVQSVQECD